MHHSASDIYTYIYIYIYIYESETSHFVVWENWHAYGFHKNNIKDYSSQFKADFKYMLVHGVNELGWSCLGCSGTLQNRLVSAVR